ncbi:MAG TPA: outer membrane protein assembly factor BamA [Victivallales bacterium]|nr:outer membrane protein assembly factor BamA [Victivallales bacterium]
MEEKITTKKVLMRKGKMSDSKIRMRKALICAAMMWSAGSLFSAEISKISFEQKGYQFPEQFLNYNLQSKVGAEFNQKILDEDIKRLFSTGRFSDVSVDTTDKDSGVEITLKTVSKPRVKNIEFSGNKKFSEKDLKEQLVVQPDAMLNDKELGDSLTAIRKFYLDKGYGSAIISHSIEELGDNNVTLKINIVENLRMKVNSVSFNGNTAYSSWKLKESIGTYYSLWNWILNTGLYSKEEVENDKLRLRELYWNKGYLDFRVKNVEVLETSGNPEYVDVKFDLDEGNPYVVGKVNVSGNTKFTSDELMSLISLKEGQMFDNRLEEKDARAIRSKYSPFGYADLSCEAVRVPDFNTHVVDIEYKIIEGPPYTVRDVNISGNANTKDHVIRRELVIHPGDPVNPDMIDTSKSRLMGMNYFEKVEAVTVRVPDPSMKDVEINVEEKDTAKFAIGGGFSDTDSLVGTVELSQSNFDLFDPDNWFTGGGQRLRLTGQYGIERSDFGIDFTEPWLFGIPLSLNLSGFYNDREYEDWSQKTGGGEISLSKRIFDDFTSLGLGYTIARVKIYDMDDDHSQIFQDEEGTDTISKLSLNLSRDTRDSLLDPKNGYLLSALGELNSKVFGATTNTYRVELQGSNYYSFIDDLFTVHTGIKLGQVDRFDGHGKPARLYDRYFLGGGDTVRGFPYREISPIDENEDPYGGESMIIGNVELTHPIYDFIRGAVFVDAGGVWRRAWDFKFDEINVGAGYGLRIKVPYFSAPIKLDLAYPIVKNSKQKNFSKKLRFHFNLGLTWSP